MTTINTHIKHRTGTTEEWNNSDYVPLNGELLVYSDMNPVGIKVGNGTTSVDDLPFITEYLDTQIGLLKGKIDNLNYQSGITSTEVEGNVVLESLYIPLTVTDNSEGDVYVSM